ncbi:MAG: beta-L-arabinofuranosidase domain-containing protein [Haloarculaceae archaeon]
MTVSPGNDGSQPLRPRRYEPLSPDAIEPRGWVRRQLEIQAAVTGRLDEVWYALADNQWLGGEHDGWERGPYYADGLVPLAHLLDDEGLLATAERWLEGFLDWQDDDGWIGPREPAEGDANDVWPQAILLKVFRQHYRVTGEERALDAALALCAHLQETVLEERSLEEWARFRWQELALGVQWLHDETGEAWLLDLVDTVAEQGFDWQSQFAGSPRTFAFPHPDPASEWSLETHVVNNVMALKEPAVTYRRSGGPTDRDRAADAVDTLDAFHGQVTGVCSGDENLAGRDPTRGTELCAVVEYMYSLEELVATFGDVRFADRLERIAFNALPAAFTRDMWAHQYDQQANQVLCAVGEYPWTNAPDANCFGLEPNFGCCTANFHQGWPKLVAGSWLRGDDALAAAVYLPSTVRTTIDGTAVTIREETDYPFEDDVRFTVEPETPATFPLEFRIPEWAGNVTLKLPDGTTRSPAAGQFHAVERTWEEGDEVTLSLSPAVEVERRYQGGVALRRGPLVFSLPIDSEARRLPGEDDVPHAHREYHPTEAWNYGLAVDTDDPDHTLRRRRPGETPFDPDAPPVELDVQGARVENWTLAGSRAGDLPASPAAAGGREQLTLVPYGCTTLRVTEFPLVESVTDRIR